MNEWTSGGPGGISTAALAVSPNFGYDRTIFAGTYSNYGYGGQGVFRSQDGGQSWWPVNNGLTDSRVNALAVSPAYAMDGTIFAGSNGGGVYKSVNGGETWSQVNTGLTWLDVASLAVSPAYAADGTVFAGTGSGRLFRSVNRGQSWVPVGPGFNEVYSIAVAANGTVFASDYGGGVSRSDDLGGTWVALGAPNNDDFISDVAVSPDYAADRTVYAGGGTLHKSTDGGVTWVPANNGGSVYNPTPGGLNIAYVGGMIVSPNYASDRSLFVGGHGVFRSRDAGATWTQIDRGLSAYVPAMGISPNFGADSTVFAGTTESSAGQGGGVFSYTIDDTFPADDWDRDGYAYDAGDCNDTNPAVNPGVAEIPGNYVDDNCNGSVDEQSLGWTSKAGLPIVVDFTTSVAVNGSLYLLGGNVVGNWAPGPVQKYDPLANAWTIAGPPLGPLTGAGAGSAAAGSTIYVFGGQTPNGPGDEIVAFDTVYGTSSQVGLMTKPRGWTNGAVIGNTLYIVGGDNPTGDPALPTDNTIEAFGLANHMSTQVAFMAEPRSDAGVAAAGSRLYIFGGLSCGQTGCVEIGTSVGYDTSTGGFFGVSPLPFPAATRVAGQLNGTVYVVTTQMGGDGGNRLLAYDIATDSWSAVSQVPSSRDFPAVALLDGTVYVVGGYDRVLSAPSARNEAYTVGTGWSIYSVNAMYPEVIDWPLSQHGPLAYGNYLSVAGTYYYVIGSGTGTWSGPDFAAAPLQQCDQYTGAPLFDAGAPRLANMSGMTGQPLTLYASWPGSGGGDTLPPYGTILVEGGAAYTSSGSVSLSLTCDDNGGSGCNQMQFSNDGSAWSSPETFSAFKAWALSSGDGVKSVQVKFSDNAGHWSGFFADSINLDTTPPSGTVSVNSGAVYASATAVTLALTCSDAGSPCSEMQLSNDGTNWSNSSFAAYTNWTLLAGDGVKTVFARFKDGAGYWSSTVPDSITLDTTPPTGSVLINGGAALTTSPVVGLSLFAADNLSGVDKVRFGYNGLGAWELMSAAKTLNLGNEGTKTVSVQFMDKAGLMSALATATIDYYVTPPGITTVALASGTIGSSYSQTIATDNKGKPTFTWAVEGGSLPAGLAIAPTGYTYSAQISGRPLVAGTSTFTIRVTDAVGNSGIKTFSLEIAPFQEWGRTMATPGQQEWSARSAVDADGNVYVTGHRVVGSDDVALLVKYDNFGNLVWTKTFGAGPNRDARGKDVAVDGDGNVYVAGYGWNDVAGRVSDDYLTLKYSPDGDLLWSRFHGGTGQDYGGAVAVAPDGIVYVTGQVYSYSSSTYNSTIVAYDAAGNELGAWTYDHQVNGGFVNNFGMDIASDAAGNMYELERWYPTGGPSWHYLVVKYQRDAAGALSKVWATPYDGGYDTPAAIAVDPAGNSVIVGESHAQWTTAKYLTAKFDPSGTLLWSRSYGYYYTSGTYGSYLDSVATDVATDAEGSIYVTGRSKVTDDSIDFVTKKYDAEGNEVWTKITAGPASVQYTATGVAVDASGSVFVAGYGYTSGNSPDLMVLKYGQSLQLQIIGDALADGSFGVPYSDFLRVTGGPQPYVWSLAGGALPAGLTLNTATGEVSGTPQGAGSYSIDVRVTDALSGTVTKTVSLVIPNPMTITTNSLADGTVGLAYYQDVLSAVGGTSPYTWSLAGGSLPAGLSLSVAGVINGTPTAAGTSSFTVQVSDSATLRAAKILSITVNKGTPILTWSDPADVVYPTGLSAAQLNATANMPGTFVYSPGFSALLNVGTGHVLSVQFTPADTANYAGAAATALLNVLMGPQAIAFNPIADRPFGADFQVVAHNSSYLTPSFTATGNCTVAPYSTNEETAVATVHMTAAGTCTVTASQGGNSNYNPAPDVSRSFTIFKLAPTITWSNPDGIVYGTSLGAAQLNATADVPGTFAYTPAAGTVLTPGSQNLSVVFTPNEGEIYEGVSKSAALVVTSSFAVATDSPLTAGFVGAPYRQTLAASGGVGTYSWQLASGSFLPAGLSLGANGTIVGTPTAAVTRSFTVQVTDENNIGAAKEISLTINPARPDLISAVVSGPTTGTRGKNISVSATVRNQGQAKAESFMVTYYLSVDEDITTADVQLGSKVLKSLGINGSATVNGNFSVPKSMAPGNYYVGVIVDSAETVAETNESNNLRGGNAIEIR